MLTKPAGAQQFKLLESFPAAAVYLTADHLDNVYLLTGRYNLVKFTPGKKEPQTFSENRYGELKYIDATNPLKLLLFYPDYLNIVLLDNNLSEVGTFQLLYQDFTDISAAGIAQDNNVWIYDTREGRLKKLDETAAVVAESESLKSLGYDIAPIQLLNRNSYVYANDTAQGIFVFDNFGSYVKRIPLTGVEQMQMRDNQLFYLKGGKLWGYNLTTFAEKEIPLPIEAPVQWFSLQANKLFLAAGERVWIFEHGL